MKLTLDSAALERLIGGDTEIEVRLRTDIASQFANKFLKSLVNSQLMRHTAGHLEELIKQELFSGVRSYGTFSAKYKTMMVTHVAEVLGTLIQQEVNEVMDTKHYKKLVDDFIEAQATRIADEWTSGSIEARIDAAANAKIKAKLGL